jgi:hypothetical protein
LSGQAERVPKGSPHSVDPCSWHGQRLVAVRLVFQKMEHVQSWKALPLVAIGIQRTRIGLKATDKRPAALSLGELLTARRDAVATLVK